MSLLDLWQQTPPEPHGARTVSFDTPEDRSTALRLTVNGRTQSAARWARELGVKPNTLRKRLRNARPE